MADVLIIVELRLLRESAPLGDPTWKAAGRFRAFGGGQPHVAEAAARSTLPPDHWGLTAAATRGRGAAVPPRPGGPGQRGQVRSGEEGHGPHRSRGRHRLDRGVRRRSRLRSRRRRSRTLRSPIDVRPPSRRPRGAASRSRAGATTAPSCASRSRRSDDGPFQPNRPLPADCLAALGMMETTTCNSGQRRLVVGGSWWLPSRRCAGRGYGRRSSSGRWGCDQIAVGMSNMVTDQKAPTGGGRSNPNMCWWPSVT
jgi:hypothetical protein